MVPVANVVVVVVVVVVDAVVIVALGGCWLLCLVGVRCWLLAVGCWFLLFDVFAV